jgi:GNAT superfamily N-acetyltransferase
MSAPPNIRRAEPRDLPAVVALFATPDEGNQKPDDARTPLDPRYEAALSAIARDPNNMLMVAEIVDGPASDAPIAGVFHLTFIQYVAYRGGLVAQIENVVVEPAHRGRGIGEAMMRWAIDEAKRRGAYRVQLTTNKVRARAHRFYARLGFVASHEGMKLVLSGDVR